MFSLFHITEERDHKDRKNKEQTKKNNALKKKSCYDSEFNFIILNSEIKYISETVVKFVQIK